MINIRIFGVQVRPIYFIISRENGFIKNYAPLSFRNFQDSTQGSDRIDSFWFAEVNQKSQITFDSRDESKSFFIIDSDSFWFTFEANELQWFILNHFDFDSTRITIQPRIMIHLRIKIKSNQKSKVGEMWFTHLRIIGWFDFEWKANHSESQIKLVRALIQGTFRA